MATHDAPARSVRSRKWGWSGDYLWLLLSSLFWILVVLRSLDVLPDALTWYILPCWFAPLTPVLWRASYVWLKSLKHDGSSAATPLTAPAVVALLALGVFIYLHLPLYVLRYLWRRTRCVTRAIGSFLRFVWSIVVRPPGFRDIVILLVLAVIWTLLVTCERQGFCVAITAAAIAAANILVIRALLLAYHPTAPMSQLLRVASLTGLVYAAIGKIQEAYGGVLRNEDAVRRGARFVRDAEALVRRVPTEERQVVPLLVLLWLSIGSATVVTYGLSFYALHHNGIEALSAAPSIQSAILASAAFFTTAPVSDLLPFGALGVFLSVLEIVDSVLLLIVFISLLVKALTGEEATKLRQLNEQKNDFPVRLGEIDSHISSEVLKLTPTRDAPSAPPDDNPERSG